MTKVTKNTLLKNLSLHFVIFSKLLKLGGCMQEIGSVRKLTCLLSKSYPLSPRFWVKYGPREDSFRDGLRLLMR